MHEPRLFDTNHSKTERRMIMLTRRLKKAIALAGAVAATAAVGALAQAGHGLAADFTDKRITVIIPYPEGGGATLYTRFWVPFLEKYLPGNPTLIVRNIPGGASIKGLNQFIRTSKTDGLTIANTGSGSYFTYFLGQKSVKYDFADFEPLVASPSGVLFYVRSELGIKTGDIEKLRSMPPLRHGGATPTGAHALYSVLFDMLGVKYNYIWGLTTGKRRQAFQREEIDVTNDYVLSYQKAVKPLIDEGIAVPFMTLGYLNEDGQYVRDPMLPDVPTFLELYERVHGEKPSGPPWKVFQSLFNGAVMNPKMLVIPRDTDPEIKAAYHAAMEKVLADPIMRSDQGRAILGDYEQVIGENAMNNMLGALERDPEAIDWLKNFLKEKFDVEL